MERIVTREGDKVGHGLECKQQCNLYKAFSWSNGLLYQTNQGHAT